MAGKSSEAKYEGDVIGAKQVSVMLNVCEKTVHNLANRKQIPCTKVGRNYRFSRIAIAKFVPSPVSSVSDGTLSNGNA